MMKAKNNLCVLFLVGLLVQQVTPAYQEWEHRLWRRARPTPQNAFANDINKCLFTAWTSGRTAVLSQKVSCPSTGTRTQLCFGNSPPTALFAVCYNKGTLIPDFTGHVVKKVDEGTNPSNNFKEENGPYAPNPEATISDYEASKQIIEHPTWNVNQQYFCSKGHLVPNSDFGPEEDRVLSYILTNAAPQWQKFNNGNWAGLEESVKDYANKENRDTYVFTGTGGIARDVSTGQPYKMNGKVQAPMYYWKAVCDPIAKQSIVFVGTNSVGSKSQTTAKGCRDVDQTTELGLIICDSLNNIKGSNKYKDFLLPPFHATNCQPSIRGTFMDDYLTNFH